MARHEPDKSSAWMIEHFSDSLLRLAGATDVQSWQSVQSVIVQPKKLPDGLLSVKFAHLKKPTLVLLEIATHPEQRAFDQAMDDLLLSKQHFGDLPDLLMVVLAEKGRLEITGSHEVTSPLQWSQITATWKMLEMWKLRAADLFATEDVGVVPWIPLTQLQQPPEDVFHRCRKLIEEKAPYKIQDNMKVVSQVFASLRYNDRDVIALLGGKAEMNKYPLIQQLIAEKMHKNISDILEARFGEVPQALVKRIKRISKEERLDKLLKWSAVCSDLDAFQLQLKS